MIDTVQALQAAGFDVASYLDHHLMLQRDRISHQLAGHTPVIGKDHQPAGGQRELGDQFRRQMFFKQCDAATVFGRSSRLR